MGFNAALKRKGRLAAGMLAFAMAFSAVIGTQKFESRAKITGVTLAGQTLTYGYYLSDGSAATADNYEIWWDDATSDVTLRNANITSTNHQSALQLTNFGNLILIGENTITNNGSTTNSYGVYCNDNLTIKGSGTLTVTGGTGVNSSYGICAPFFIQGDVTVNAIGGTATNGVSAGLSQPLTKSCSIRENAKVNATGGTSNTSYGIYWNGGGLTFMENCVVNATGETNGIYHNDAVNRLAFTGFRKIIAESTGGGQAIVSTIPATLPKNYAYRETDSGAYTKSTVTPLGSITNTGEYFELVAMYTLTPSDNNPAAVSQASTANDTVYYEGETVSLTQGTPNAGYEFNGWTSNEVTGITGDSFAMPAQNTTVTANWSPIDYNITYNLDGGTELTNPTTYNVTTADITLNDPTKTGYTFDGWYTDATLQNPAPATTQIPLGSTGNKEFWAKYTPIEYNIDYQMNGGGDKGTNPDTYNITDVIVLAAAGIRDGYTFEGWFSDNNTFNNKVEQIGPNETGNKTLYANWSIVDYGITYHLDGGTELTNPTTYNVTTADITLNNPTKEHYTFDGWYTDAALQTPAPATTQIPLGSTGAKEFWAKYTPIEYNIDYQMNGGGDKGTNPDTYNITDVIVLAAAGIRDGYTFEGWFSDNNTFNNKVEQIGPNETGDKTLYAKWRTKYAGDIDVNGTETPVIEDEVITLPTPSPVPDGYEFERWEVSPDKYTNNITDPTNPNSTFKVPGEYVSLTPKWTPIEYTITYNVGEGRNAAANPASYNIESETITLAEPTITGFYFGGWYTDAEFKNPVARIEKGSMGNRTLYAKWDEYKIIMGQGGIHQLKSGGTLSFTATGHFKDFTDVLVDSAVIDGNSYSAVEGSTVVTLTTEYLDTLSVGTHSITVRYNNGEASTTFEVQAAPLQGGGEQAPTGGGTTTTGGGTAGGGTGTNVVIFTETGTGYRAPKTFDETSVMLLGGAGLAAAVSLIGMVAVIKKRREYRE